MKLLDIIEDDFVNYRVPSMTLEFPFCTFKCEKECGEPVCQNHKLKNDIYYDYDIDDIIAAYDKDEISASIVFQGLEPLDSFDDVIDFIDKFRSNHIDDIVIYTGYTEDEVISKGWYNKLASYCNVVVKFGRFVPNSNSVKDSVLGVKLASINQYGKRISYIDI